MGTGTGKTLMFVTPYKMICFLKSLKYLSGVLRIREALYMHPYKATHRFISYCECSMLLSLKSAKMGLILLI